VTSEKASARGDSASSTRVQCLGFIAGPLVGGLLGTLWIRAPFMAAAGLMASLFGDPVGSSRAGAAAATEGEGVLRKSLRTFQWAWSVPPCCPADTCSWYSRSLVRWGGTIWIIYGSDRYVGHRSGSACPSPSLVCCTRSRRRSIAGPLSERRGERFALAMGLITDSAASVLIAFATTGWMAFALMPLFGLAPWACLPCNRCERQSRRSNRDDCKAIWPASRALPPLWGRWQSAHFISPIVRAFQASSGLPARRFISSLSCSIAPAGKKPPPPRTPDQSVRPLKPVSDEWSRPPCGW